LREEKLKGFIKEFFVHMAGCGEQLPESFIDAKSNKKIVV